MARRQLKPYRQGQLDGLCGVYALINALRLLCPRLDEDACERAFCALIQARARQAASPLTVIHAGLSWRELLRLIGVWQRFAAREFGISVTVSRLRVAEPSLRGLWRGLCRALDGRAWRLLAWMGSSGIGQWPTPRRRGPCGSRTRPVCGRSFARNAPWGARACAISFGLPKCWS